MEKKIKQGIIGILIILLIGAGFLPTVASTTQITQSTSNPGTTWIVPRDFPTLQDALDASVVINGDTILVYFNTEPEHLTTAITKELEIIGIAEDYYTGDITEKPIIDGEDQGSVIILAGMNYITIKGFQIINSGSDPGDSGIDLNACEYIIIENNFIDNNLLGIKLDQCSYCGIYLNTISNNNGRGIDIRDSDNNLIVLNHVILNNVGIALTLSWDNMFTWNHVVNNTQYGVFPFNPIWVQPEENIFKHNNIYNNGKRDARTGKALNIWSANYWGGSKFYLILGFPPQMDPNPSDTEYFVP
jgi:parallel beta-helix repeat protein